MEGLVLPDENDLHRPGTEGTSSRESGHGNHRECIARLIGVAEEVWRVNKGGVGEGRHHGNDNSLLLLCLRADRGGPA